MVQAAVLTLAYATWEVKQHSHPPLHVSGQALLHRLQLNSWLATSATSLWVLLALSQLALEH